MVIQDANIKGRFKVLVTGFFNSGKTTLVKNLDPEAVVVEKPLREPLSEEKTTTTTGYDQGSVVWARPDLDPQTYGLILTKDEFHKNKEEEYDGWHFFEVILKGTPGQMQFASVRKVLARGSDGVLFLIDGCNLQNVGKAMAILEEIKSVVGPNVPMRIIANKCDRDDHHGAERISELIGSEVYPGAGEYDIGIRDALLDILKMIEKERLEKIREKN